MNTVPVVQAIDENIRNIVNKTVAIKTELEECCEEIKELLKQVLNRLKRVETKVIKQIIETGNVITDFISNQFESLYEFYYREKEKLNVFINEQINVFKNELKDLITEETNSLLLKIEESNEKICSRIDSLNQEISRVKQEVSLLKTEVESVKTKTTRVEELCVGIETSVGEVIVGLGVLDTYNININTPGLAGIATELTSGLIFLKNKSLIDNKVVKSEIGKVIKNVNENTSKTIKEYQNHSDKQFEELPVLSAKETSLWVVGEAYQKWDNISAYHPCLVFVFNEETNGNYPRRVQLKIRLRIKNSDLTETKIQEIKSKVFLNKNLSYMYGVVKGNFVTADKRFKTTIFGKDKATIEKVLKKTMEIAGNNFDSNLLTITSGGKLR